MIFGTGALAEMVHFYLDRDSPHEVVAFTDEREDVGECRGLPVVPFSQVAESYPPDQYRMFVAVGYRRVNQLRAKFFEEARALGYRFVSYISSKATHWDANEIGENVFVFEDNTIQPFVKIGDDVILWSGNHLGHWAQIGDHCFLTSHVVVSGYTKIGDYTFIGVNATLRDEITIGRSNLIGAGAIIMRDTEDYEVYVPPRTKPSEKRSDEIDF